MFSSLTPLDAWASAIVPSELLSNARWKREAGSWKLEAGSWKPEAGSWKLEAGSRKLTVPCILTGMAKIASDEAVRRLKALPSWELEGDAIKRLLTFPGFPEAVAFVVRLGFTAEAADHHPDLLVSYKRVTVTYSTHSAGGLTEKDFEGAAAVSTIAAGMGAK